MTQIPHKAGKTCFAGEGQHKRKKPHWDIKGFYKPGINMSVLFSSSIFVLISWCSQTSPKHGVNLHLFLWAREQTGDGWVTPRAPTNAPEKQRNLPKLPNTNILLVSSPPKIIHVFGLQYNSNKSCKSTSKEGAVSLNQKKITGWEKLVTHFHYQHTVFNALNASIHQKISPSNYKFYLAEMSGSAVQITQPTIRFGS